MIEKTEQKNVKKRDFTSIIGAKNVKNNALDRWKIKVAFSIIFRPQKTAQMGCKPMKKRFLIGF